LDTQPRKQRKWPLYVIGSSASVAVWSGWVGLGQMCGFGLVHPLPGITLLHLDDFQLNTSITLPVGVEAYAAYALGAWISRTTPKAARRFAKWSALGSIGLGMLGQLTYHLLSAAGYVKAPWPVITIVSILPVLTLGFAAGLFHLLQQHDEPSAMSTGQDPAMVERTFTDEDEEDRPMPMPKLEALMRSKAPWDDVEESPVPNTVAQPVQQPTYQPADDYDDADLYDEDPANPSVHQPERNRRPRLDNKLPYDRRAAAPRQFSPRNVTSRRLEE
jgi:hypothetical protein